MMNVYKKTDAKKSDLLFSNCDNSFCYEGFVDDAIRFVEDFQLLDPVQWHRFVTQFKDNTDTDNGWRGEYWGKMMRGAALTYSYTKNEELYRILCDTVEEMIQARDETGRISSFPLADEFHGWDLWCRKYVLLGMQYFLEICRDEDLASRVITSMKEQADYIIDHIGDEEEGKLPIVKASNNWRGMNSSSILEPIVRLYSITKEERYLDFAKYIVELGGTEIFNIFEAALQNDLLPYQYPLTKAYEMISCFEGLLEYYHVTGIEKYKTAIVQFADRILESDFTVIGSAGCTHELFDHSTVRQANTDLGHSQETCVTVTLMKFFYRLTLLTGDSKYADAFEQSLYNAYFGAINTERVLGPNFAAKHPGWILDPLPFDSYSPLTAGIRGDEVGGQKLMPDMHYYGCCACIGSAGNGLIPKMQLLSCKEGFAMNLYVNGTVGSKTPAGEDIVFDIETAYPREGEVRITLFTECEEKFTLALRNPAWSKTTRLLVNGEEQAVNEGYVSLCRTWKNGDSVTLTLDMRTEAIYPTPYGSQILMNEVNWSAHYVLPSFDREDSMAHRHIALRRGPVMLAQENRLGYCVDDPIEVAVNADGYVDVRLPDESHAPYPSVVEAYIPLLNGKEMLVTDYASAGKLWNEESKMAVWMKTT